MVFAQIIYYLCETALSLGGLAAGAMTLQSSGRRQNQSDYKINKHSVKYEA